MPTSWAPPRRLRSLWPLAAVAVLFVLGSGSAFAAQLSGVSFWRDGQAVSGFDLGVRSPGRDGRVFSQPVWILTTGQDAQGQQRVVAGQRSIFDVNAGDPAYTDLWQAVFVTVPETYQANAARSVADLLAAGYPQTVTSLYLNCPFASQGDSLSGSNLPLLQGWVGGETVWYFDFGPATPETGTVWEFTHSTAGAPLPVPGQFPVIDASGASFYRLVWVQVPDDFVAGRITTADDVQASGNSLLPTNQFVNLAGLPQPQARFGGQAALVAAGLVALTFILAAGYIIRAS